MELVMDPKAIYEEAFEAANAAADACMPMPMVVGQAVGFSNFMVPGTMEFVADGVCGFAWVKIRPARGEFVKFCKANNIGYRDDYAGGYLISMRQGNQSMQRKEAAGRAFAAVLVKHGIKAHMQSRMD